MSAGGIQLWLLDSLPPGFLPCEGGEVDKIFYADLYAVIGDIYGPALLATDFRLPDLRGRFPRSFAGVAAPTGDPQANLRGGRGDGFGGNMVGTPQSHAYQAHSHTWPNGTGGVNQASTAPAIRIRFGPFNPPSFAYGGSETRPKNIYIRPIIEY